MLLPMLGAFLLGIAVYQLPVRTAISIGSFGDQLFLDSSEALDAASDTGGSWYADELGNGERSRWTRSHARIAFPGAGGGEAEITLHVQGWPADVSHGGTRQPTVTVRAGDGSRAVPVGQFKPASDWREQRITIPAAARASADLVIQLDVSDVFTRTTRFGDPRPKGIRIDRVGLELGRPDGMRETGWTAVLELVGAVLLGTVAVRRRTAHPDLAVLFGAGLATAGLTALLLWRPWTAPLMLPTLGVAALGLLLAGHQEVWRFGRATVARLEVGRIRSLGAAFGLVASGALVAVTIITHAFVANNGDVLANSDRLIQLLPPLVIGGILAAAGPSVMPDALRSLRRKLLVGRLTPVLLALAGGVVLGWETQLLRQLPFVGHADYADNAVVARSLLRGQGWTVPYVTQFYRLVPGGTVYRPQETWPLLQPLWMVPWMALFGPTAFAARLSNIVFNVVLLLLIYHIGTTIWDRRVGLLAAVLTLLNFFVFLQAVYSTTDLGFTVLSMAALWLFYRAWNSATDPALLAMRPAQGESRLPWLGATWRRPVTRWTAAGIMTGLMILQKPTGAILGVGMVLWALVRWRQSHSAAQPTLKGLPWRELLVWGGVVALMILPYVVRNLLIFGQPIYSTESYDAWILGYRGTGGEAWEEIYRIYFGDLPNRSWILRWGWDRTLAKLLTQIGAVRKYLLPPKGLLLGDPGYEGMWLGVRLSTVAPTWMGILGLTTLRRRQRSLLGLVGLAGGLYTLFLVTYWHANEERYFVPFIPWLLLLAMAALCAFFDRALLYRGGRWAGLAGGLAILLLWSTLQPQLSKIDAFLDPQSDDYWGRDWLPDLSAYGWLEAHTQPGDVIMTRVPWQLSFEADRPSVMIPNAPLVSDDPRTPTIMQVARYYRAKYLVVNAMSTPGPLAQEGLQPLSRGKAYLGFTSVYSGTEQLGRRPIYIYRFPPDYAGAIALRP